jgi:hypothetical protein
MRYRGLVVGLAASAVLVCAGSSGAVDAASTYTDPTGDQQGTAPDITTVGVANDVRGQITFRLNVANQPALAADSTLFLLIDSDSNPATGAPDTLGSDFYFSLATDGYTFARWNGSDWDFDTPYATVQVSYVSNGATFSVNRSEIGNTNGFNFWTRGLQEVPPSTDNIDDAPNDGTWTYAMTGTVAHGVVGQKSMRRVRNGLRATFVFRTVPVEGSRVRVDWYDRARSRTFARPMYPLARTISSSALGLSPGLYQATLRVRPPGQAWRTVATVRGRR